MAKKQLKKLNQPKKYLQGGSNMSSVSMMRQNPYYLGQVNQNATEEDLANMQEQVMQNKQTAAQAKKDARDMQNEQLDQTIRNNTSNLVKATATDQKAGRLGKFFTKEPMTGVAGMNAMTEVGANAVNTTSAAFAPIAASTAPTAATIGQVGQLVNPIYTSAGGNAATQMVVGQAAPTMSTVGQTVTGGANVASTGTATAGQVTSGLSSLATAGIGAAAAIGGKVIQKRADDNSAYTFTDKERRGNIGGSALSAAGTVVGPALNPAVLAATGGLSALAIPLAAGYGALKARKENKAAQEEADRLQREQAAMRGTYQSAFVNSRLTGADTGFGLNSSTNMNNQFTNQYQVAQTGGVKRVPGGQIVPIEGTDAVEFKGRSHKQGGIIIDKDANGNPTVEVEKDEVMLPLKMKDGKKQDYIFSDYLKIGNESFAQKSKNILKGGGTKADLQQLAVMQEKMAGRNSETVAVAKYGGIPQYATGGVPTNTDPILNSKPAVPAVISSPGKGYSQKEKDAGWKYVYDIAQNLGDPFPEVTASQWALESGWGSSNTGTFNPFGQTASKGESATKLNTPKDPGGGSKRFKNYTSYEEAIQDHINRWAPKYKNAKDPLEAVYMLQNHGGAPRYAEGHNNDWEGYVKKIITISDSRAKDFGVLRQSTYVPDKTKYPKAKGVNTSSTADSTPVVKTTPKLLPPPPVSGDVIPATFAQRNALPGIGSMQINEEIQMPEQPKSNITFDPTGPDNVNSQMPMKYITTETLEVNDRNFKRRKKVKSDNDANVPTNAQAAADTQTIITQQNGTTNAPAAASANAAYSTPTGIQPAKSPSPVAVTTNGGPGTAPTINNQNSTFEYTAKTPGYLDYNDPNTAGGIFSGDRYEKEWKPLVGSTMADAAKADQVINYLTNYTGTDADDVKAKLKGKNKAEQIAAINDLATDTKVGPFHNAVFGAMQQVNSGGGNVATNIPPANTGTGSGTTTNTGTTTGTSTRRYTPCPPGTYLSTDGTCKQTPEYSKPYDKNIVAAIGAGAQLIPPIYAALKPYQKVGAIPGAPSVRGALLGRENMNTERGNVRDMYTAVNQEVTNNNTGAAGFAIRQIANVTAGKQMLDVANAEAKINTELRGKEAVLGQDASKYNAENSMKGQMFNADLEQRQNQYVDERNIGVVDAAANRLAGMANTYNQYKATDHLAIVTNANTHSLERDKMYESLLKDAQNKNSQFNGASDAELRRIAAGLVEEQMGGVGRTGGVRQYISRLGELKSARATKAKL